VERGLKPAADPAWLAIAAMYRRANRDSGQPSVGVFPNGYNLRFTCREYMYNGSNRPSHTVIRVHILVSWTKALEPL